MKKQVKLKKEYNQYDLTDMFMRGLYYGDNLCRYKNDVDIDSDNKELYDYILEAMKNKQSLKDIVNLPLEMFLILYHEVYTKNETKTEDVKENSKKSLAK